MLDLLETIASNVSETIGIAAFIPTLLFWITYQRHANWRTNRPGRAIMWHVRGLTLSFGLLVLFSLINLPDGWHWLRWAIEAMVYLPLAIACWYYYLSLRHQLGLNPNFLFRVGRKAGPEEDQEELENTQPPGGPLATPQTPQTPPESFGQHDPTEEHR